MPPLYKMYMQSCLNVNQGWTMKIWNESNIFTEIPINATFYHNLPRPEVQKDYIEMLVLKQYGGIFLDVDFTCLH